MKTVENVSRVNSLETVVNKQHKVITAMFEQRWLVAMANFGISMPLKVHIICHHLSDYFQLTGQTLRRVNAFSIIPSN